MRFRYTGQQLLAPLNLYYYKARIYSPTLGRFLQTDQIGQQDDMNLYAYVKNNAMNSIDLTGMYASHLAGQIKDAYSGIGAGGGPQYYDAGVGSMVTEPGLETVTLGMDNLPPVRYTKYGVMANSETNSGRSQQTKHGQQRTQEATSDSHRQVGDANKVVVHGKKYTDNDTGNTVYVSGDRVVIYNQSGQKVTQFKNTRANTNSRVVSGKWIPE